jgi:cytochrome bd-type quinol oxidase subunit 1
VIGSGARRGFFRDRRVEPADVGRAPAADGVGGVTRRREPAEPLRDHAAPPFGSLIDSDSLTAGEVGLNSIPRENWPPILIPFFTFRIMVGCGLVMLALAWIGSYQLLKKRIERSRWLLWSTFLGFPLPFIAILTGWHTAEVGRQPWVVYGVLRTADAMTPFLTARAKVASTPQHY